MISIIMPVKNEALHLNTLLDSIISQSEKDFELIAIDDHSTDNSINILRNYSTKDQRIKVFKNPGMGIVSALQFAYSKAQGEYITRQDSDDILPKNKLELLLNILKENGKGIVATGKVKYFSDFELKDGFKKYESWLNHLCDTNSHYDQIFKECVLVSANWLMHRDDFELIGAFNNALYPEDYHLAFRCFENNLKIISTKEVTHLWRDHQNRASRNLEEYQDQKFFSLKVLYFKKIFGSENICLWGAGPTGKKLAKELIANEIKFHWVTNNERKIGKNIYGVDIYDLESLKNRPHQKVIISVTQRGSLDSIIEYLNEINVSNYYEF